MPELKMCPDCHWNRYPDEPSKELIYDTKFLCLTCDRIYQNNKPEYTMADWSKLIPYPIVKAPIPFPFNYIEVPPITDFDLAIGSKTTIIYYENGEIKWTFERS